MRTAAILITVTSLYLSNGSTLAAKFGMMIPVDHINHIGR